MARPKKNREEVATVEITEQSQPETETVANAPVDAPTTEPETAPVEAEASEEVPVLSERWDRICSEICWRMRSVRWGSTRED